jgi:hypothetical protein
MSDVPAGNQPGEGTGDEIEPIEPEIDPETGEPVEPEPEPEIDPETGEPVEPEPEDEPGQTRPVASRGRARGETYGAQIRRLEAARAADRAQFERQLAELTAARQQPSPAEIAAQQEAERQRYELMTDYEKFQYTRQAINQEVNRQTQQIAHNLWDQNDQRNYDDLLERTPAYRRFGDQVAELKRQAPGIPRRVLLATAIGLKALEQNGAATTRAATRAAAATARNGVRPAGGRSDVSGDRARRGDDLEERLRGQAI